MYTKNLIKKSTGAANIYEEVQTNEGTIIIDGDLKSTNVILDRQNVLSVFSMDTSKLLTTLGTVYELLSDPSKDNASVEFEGVADDSDVSFEINRYGLDITQTIVRIGKIGGYQFISDNSTILNELTRIRRSITGINVPGKPINIISK